MYCWLLKSVYVIVAHIQEIYKPKCVIEAVTTPAALRSPPLTSLPPVTTRHSWAFWNPVLLLCLYIVIFFLTLNFFVKQSDIGSLLWPCHVLYIRPGAAGHFVPSERSYKQCDCEVSYVSLWYVQDFNFGFSSIATITYWLHGYLGFYMENHFICK